MALWDERASAEIGHIERILGFSVPVDGRMVVISYEAMHLIDLPSLWVVERDETLAEGGEAYDLRAQTLVHRGLAYPILGVTGGTYALTTSPQGERITVGIGSECVDSTERILRVLEHDDWAAFEQRVDDYSGDWCHATYAPDGRFIVIGAPYDLFILRRQDTATPDPITRL